MCETEYIQVMTTIDDLGKANKLSKLLVEKKLAACVQLMKVKSTYRWEGKIQSEIEYLLLIKTKKELYKELERVIKENHPYQVPEILAIPVIAGYSDYLDWVSQEVKKKSDL